MKLPKAVKLFLHHAESHLAASTLVQYKHHTGVLVHFFAEHYPGTRLAEIDLRMLEDFFAYLYKDREACTTTLCHYQTTLRSFFHWATTTVGLPGSPMDDMRRFHRPDTLPHYLTLETLVHLLREIDRQADAHELGRRDALIVWTLALTGLRRAEACCLDWRDIDFGAKLLIVREGKGAKDRAIPLLPVLVERIKLYWEERNKPTYGPVFPSSRGGKRMHPNSLWEVFVRHVRPIIPDVTPHTLRHTLATLLCQNGAGLRHVQELLGHASLATTQKYTHLAPKDVREALARLTI